MMSRLLAAAVPVAFAWAGYRKGGLARAALAGALGYAIVYVPLPPPLGGPR